MTILKLSERTRTIPVDRRDMTTVRLQIFNNHGCLLDTHDITVTDISETDTAATAALIKLLRHTWTIAPGDVIRINEV